MPDSRLNVADRLSNIAARMPTAIAVACPSRPASRYSWSRRGEFSERFTTVTFAELDAEATRLARGLLAWGVPPGTRLALLVRPGTEFVALVFALLRAGMVIVLVDPGLGRRNLVRCLAAVEPEGFVAVGAAQAARLLLRHKFLRAKWNVTVGRRWRWGGLTLDELRKMGNPVTSDAPNSPLLAPCSLLPATSPDDPAAIIFTSGSTGPPKGVLYTHRMFDTQVAEIQSMYAIQPGGIDLACFPLFALFNSAMGVTTVFPEMDFSRPATADPHKLIAAANLWRATQAFASPAVWRIVGDHCQKTGDRIDSLRQVFSCGAPVGADILRKTLDCVAPGAKMHTPYGATECLPVSTIEATEVLNETAAHTNVGAGVCVGRKFGPIDWRVIRITDDPIATLDEAEVLPLGEIGELIVRGPQASPEYVTNTRANELSKISDFGFRISDSNAKSAIRNPQSAIHAWHRMGDVGYLDDQNRFWYCGRKSQRVVTIDGPIFTECAEAVFNTHPDVTRTTLASLGAMGRQLPVLFYQLHTELARRPMEMASELRAIGLRFPHTSSIKLFAEFDAIPVDIRHNAKILREEMNEWAKELELTETDISESLG